MTTTRRQPRRSKRETESAETDYKSQLWKMADALRGSMDAAEYKHVVLGLIFLKYISDAFEEAYVQAGSRAGPGRRPRGPRRVPRPEHLLGASRGQVAATAGPSPTAQPSAASLTTP